MITFNKSSVLFAPIFAIVLFYVYPGCSCAHPNGDTQDIEINSSTAEEKIQLKRRPSYVSSKIVADLKLNATIEAMRRPVPKDTRVFYTTPEEKGMGFSIGDTRDGYLVNGQPLPQPGDVIRQLPVQYERGLTYATPDFIRLMTDTAKAMQKKYPGTVMYMGNMSAREGGDIPYSVSHNAGRDGDVSFYFLTEKGKFAHPLNLYKINRSLQVRTADGILTFDLEKNTTLVELLLTHPKVHVQFIFLAKYIRTAIQKELVQRGASEDLLARFEAVVQVQAAHNDHFHVRTYCSDADICAGCIDRSIVHEFHQDPVEKQAKCVSKHLSVLSSSKSDSAHQAASLQRLALLGGVKDHSAKVLKYLDNEDAHVRSAAALALQSLGNGAAKPLSERLKIETDSEVRRGIIASLCTTDVKETRDTFNEEVVNLAKSGDDSDSLYRILRYMAHHPSPEFLDALLDALNIASDADYSKVLEALNAVANRDFCKSLSERNACQAKVVAWAEKNRAKSHQYWLTSGFVAGGYKVTDLSNKDIPVLLDAISGPRALSINAQIILRKLGKLEQDSLEWSEADALWHYTRYFKRRAKKYKIDLSDRDEKGNHI